MGEVTNLPGTCTVCGHREPIVADISARVSFRKLAGASGFLFSMRLCQGCTDLIGLNEESVREAGSAIPDESPLCACGKEAAVLTSQGYRCRDCI